MEMAVQLAHMHAAPHNTIINFIESLVVYFFSID
jgi:hypothetical protein